MELMSTKGDSLSPADALFVWGGAVLEWLAASMLAIWLLFQPAVFEVYYPKAVQRGNARDATAIVRWLWSSEEARLINTHLQSGALSMKEIAHYADVRRVLRQGFFLMLAAVALLGVLLVIRRPSKTILAWVQARVCFLSAAFLLMLAILGFWDWRALFSALHDPFFGPTSWRFPKGSYSLALYPATFWQLMGVVALALPPGLAFAGYIFLRPKGGKLRSTKEMPLASASPN
jgi:integral membrane protein (TIGR01906 family)